MCDEPAVSRTEAIAAVARVIERGAARGLTREAVGFLATLSGRALVDGLADAGFTINRRPGAARQPGAVESAAP